MRLGFLRLHVAGAALFALSIGGVLGTGCGGSDISGAVAPSGNSPIASRYVATYVAPLYRGEHTLPRFSTDGRIVLSTGEDQYSVWQNGTLTPLPKGFVGLAVNASGVVAGQDATRHAAIYANGTVTTIPGLPTVAEAQAISDAGQVAGVISMRKPFVYQNGQLTELPLPEGFFPTITRITPDGRIFGSMSNNDGSSRKTVWWQNGELSVVNDFSGVDINPQGQIAGSHLGPPYNVAVIQESSQTRPLAAQESLAAGISNQGVVVGTLYGPITEGRVNPQPFLWYNGELVSVRERVYPNPEPGSGPLQEGRAIRSDGAILVTAGRDIDGRGRYYLLTPQR